MSNKSSASASSASNLRTQLLEFLIDSAHELQVIPIVKYTALSLFADRFYDSFRSSRLVGVENLGHWLLKPIRESNLQLFALISLWISSKIHNSSPLSVKTLKSFGDKSITEQHFTTRDFLEAEIVFLQVLDYELGAGNVAFTFLEDLLSQLKGMAKVGELVNLEACMDIMDLLYETEDSSLLYSCSLSLAASTLVASYVITVPKQRWEFPVLPWAKEHSREETLKVVIYDVALYNLIREFLLLEAVKSVTCFREEYIMETVRKILKHVFLVDTTKATRE